MFAAIKNWVRGGFRERLEKVPASFLLEGLEKDWAEELLLGVQSRRQILTEVEDLLIGLPKAERRDLVTRTACRFALYVVDLPASERDHDAGPFGLLDHSLRVARAATGELVRPGFRASEDPAENYREQPIWAYAGFVLGLLHDAGKILDLEVVAKAGKPAWNPEAEPLAAYLSRCGLGRSGPGSWHWKRGRGTRAHVDALGTLVPLLLPAPAKFRLGNRLGRLIQVFQETYATGREVWARDPAGQVALVVRQWDQKLSKAGKEEPRTETSKAPKERALSDKVLPGAGQELGREVVNPSRADCALPPLPPEPDQIPLAILPPALAASPGAPTAAAKPSPESRNAQESRERELRDNKVEKELQPDQLMRSIRGAIKNAKVSRNGSRGPVFVCKDYIWLKYPEAFIRIMEHVGIRFSVPIGERILSTLLGCPETVPEHPRSALVLGVIPPRGKDPEAFVRFRAEGFFPEEVLAQLGLWPHEIKAPPAPGPRALGARQLPLWPEKRA